MRAAFLEDARPADVSQAVRAVLERRGALVTEHIGSRVRFQVKPQDAGWSWTRTGYVGIYQPYGEKDVEARLLLRARWPHRIFWLVALVDVLVALLTFVVNPPGTTWFLLAFLTGLALLLSGLAYVNTWRHVRAEERDLMEAFEEEFRAQAIASALEDEEERELRELEAALEGDIARRQAAERRKHEPKPEKRLSLPRPSLPKPKFKLAVGGRKEKASDEDDLEAKRRRLEELRAKKAEMERERGRE